MLEYAPNWQQTVEWLQYVAFVVAFFVAFGMGANDCANSYGTVVGAKVLKLWQAYLLATVFETVGAGMLGYRVTETMRKNIVNVDVYSVYSVYNNATNAYELVEPSKCLPDNATNSTVVSNNNETLYACTQYTSLEFMLGELGVLIGESDFFIVAKLSFTKYRLNILITQTLAFLIYRLMVHFNTHPFLVGTAAWLLIATVFHAPVSTTHSAVGATIGFALVFKGSQGANFMQIVHIVVSWVASPVLAGFFSVIVYVIIRYTVFTREDPFASSLRMLPVFYFITLLVNLFSVLYGGSKYLKLDTLSWWQCLLISFGLSMTISLVMQFYGVRSISDRIRRRHEKAGKPMDSGNARLYKPNAAAPTSSNKENSDRAVDAQLTMNIIAPLNSAEEDESNVDKSDCTAKMTGEEVSGSFNGKNCKPKLDVGRKRARLFCSNKRGGPPLHEEPMAQEVFNYLQILSACFLSFSHGSNDTANAVGPLVAIWCTISEGRANADMSKTGALEYLILFGAGSMIMGLWVLGHKVITTIGTKLTEVTSPSGFSMELGTAFTVLVASKMGIPISTTHCAVGAVVCVGWMRTSGGGVSWKTFRNIAIAWLITLPVSGSIAAFASWLLITNIH
ncbi:phosphate transporter family protein [Trichuris trichiura]|uniref:Phosphate transporter n=1 Tax=Trichuris trichiura TaxID=36087 RepID=A0A077Z867_TRITR|nr:phosphate transporter family protein [Trichuris trichiura]